MLRSATSAQPLHDPSHLNQNSLMSQIEDTVKRIETIKNKNIVLFFGSSNAGKSTSIALLCGKELEKKPISEITGEPNRKGYALVLKNPSDPEAPKIGNKKICETVYHKLYTSSNKEYQLCDCPGYNESRSIELEIAENIATKMIAENVSGMSLVICVELPSLINSRGEEFRNCFNSLRNLFHTWDNDFKESLLFLVTHNYHHQYTKENLIAELNSFQGVDPQLIEFITRQNGKYIQLFTEVGKEDEMGMKETALAIHKIIKGLKYVKVNKAHIGNPLTDRAKNKLKTTFAPTIAEANIWLENYFDTIKELPKAESNHKKYTLKANKELQNLKEQLHQVGVNLPIETITNFAEAILTKENEIVNLRNDTSDYVPVQLRNRVTIPIQHVDVQVKPTWLDYCKYAGGGIAGGAALAAFPPAGLAAAAGTLLLPVAAGGGGGLGLFAADIFCTSRETRVSEEPVQRELQLNSDTPLKRVKKIKVNHTGSFATEQYSSNNTNYKVVYISPAGGGAEAAIEGVIPKNESHEAKQNILILNLENVYLKEKKEEDKAKKELDKIKSKKAELSGCLESKKTTYKTILLLKDLLDSGNESIIADPVSLIQFTRNYQKFNTNRN